MRGDTSERYHARGVACKPTMHVASGEGEPGSGLRWRQSCRKGCTLPLSFLNLGASYFRASGVRNMVVSCASSDPAVEYSRSLVTMPFPLRFPLAFDGKLLGQILRIFTDTVAKWYRERHVERGLPDGETGAVTAIQRANSDLRLSPHFHTLFLDGVYSADREGKGRMFHPAPAPSQEEIEQLVEGAGKRILRFLERRGVITLVTAPGDGELTLVTDETLAEKDLLLAKLLAAATAAQSAFLSEVHDDMNVSDELSRHPRSWPGVGEPKQNRTSSNVRRESLPEGSEKRLLAVPEGFHSLDSAVAATSSPPAPVACGHSGGLLQWGRRPRATESAQEDMLELMDQMLQWGRRPRATESGHARKGARGLSRFNGAVARKRRKAADLKYRMDSRSGFNGAVARERRKGPHLKWPWEVRCQLQWGVARERRKAANVRAQGILLCLLQWGTTASFAQNMAARWQRS